MQLGQSLPTQPSATHLLQGESVCLPREHRGILISGSFVSLSSSLSIAASVSYPFAMCLSLQSSCTAPSNPGTAPVLQPRHCSSAPTCCWFVSTFPGFPILLQNAEAHFPLCFSSSYPFLSFPHTSSKLTASTIQCATTGSGTAWISEQPFLELLWKHEKC